MAVIKLSCPHCAKGYKIDEAHRGRKTTCKVCGGKFVIGGASADQPVAGGSMPAPAAVPKGEAAAKERPRGEDGILRDWEPGDVILDLYEVMRLPRTKHGYAEGGMGRVNLVRHREWQMDLAVKSVLPTKSASAEDIGKFKTEAKQWVEKIGLHPNIVACHYVRELGGVPRVFIEYVDGGTLQEWIVSKQLYEGGPRAALARILDVAIQTAWGLYYVHELGLIHQDVKPLNMMMTADGIAKVTDFGLAGARAVAFEADEQRPAGATILASWSGMTPAYCSPEQAEIAAKKKARTPREQWPKVTRRTDIWSWAVSVLHMFLGKIAWPGGQVAHLGLQRESDEPYLPSMPPAVKELLRTCLQKRPEDRPHDLMQVADALQLIYQQVTGQSYPREQPKPEEALADTLNNRAVSLFYLERRQQEAEQKLQEALQVDLQHPEAIYNVGLLQWRSARITDEQLLQRLRGARTACPQPSRTDYLVGLVHLERNDCKGAIQVLAGATGAGRGDVASALALAQSRVTSSGGLLRTFDEHPGHVMSLAWSPDGRLALSGMNNSLWLWEVSSGHCLRSFEGHTDLVTSVAWNRDGTFGLSGSQDNSMRLWDVSSGRLLHSFEGHTDHVTSVAWSPDGRSAISAGRDGTVRLWEVSSGRCLRTFESRIGVTSVAWSPDGRFALSGNGLRGTSLSPSEYECLRLWDLSSGQCLRTFEGHQGWVYAVAWSPDGRFALSGSGDQTLRLWEVPSGRCLRTFEGHAQEVNAVAWSPDGRFALSCSSDETVRLWEVSSGRCLRTFDGSLEWLTSLTPSSPGEAWSGRTLDGALGWLTSVAWSPDGRFALAGGDGPLRLWCVAPTAHPVPLVISQPLTLNSKGYHRLLNQAREALEDGRPADAVAFLEQARQQPGCARRADALDLAKQLTRLVAHRAFSGGWEKRVFSDHPSGVASVAWSPDAKFALAANLDHTLVLWEVSSGRPLRTFEGHTQHVFSVAWSPDGRFALSASWDTTLRLWEISSGRCVRTLTGHTHFVTSVAWSFDGRFALSGSYDKTLRLWELATGRCLRSFVGHKEAVNSVAWSPDGRFALSGEGGNAVPSGAYSVCLWEISSGRCLHTFRGLTQIVKSVAWSPDGRLALAGSSDDLPGHSSLQLWDVPTGSPCGGFAGHTDTVTSAAFSPDGRFVLSGSRDKTVRLWEMDSGDCLHTFEGHTDIVTSVAWSPDGSFALSGSYDGTLRLWELDWEFEPNQPADWNEGARPFLNAFLTLHTPSVDGMVRQGKPSWTEDDFRRLLDKLGCAGYGWLRPEGVRRELQKMASTWQGPPPLVP